METELRGCLRIDAPEWYRRQDFRDFLNGQREGQEGRPPAMWHRRGEEPDEMSDVFVTYDSGEGSDAEGIIPDDIWEAICVAAEKHGFEDGIVWISNVGHDRVLQREIRYEPAEQVPWASYRNGKLIGRDQSEQAAKLRQAAYQETRQ